MGNQHNTPERWRRVSALFDAAWELPAASRESYVREQVGDDTELLDEVLLLLAEAGESDADDTRFLTGAASRETPVYQPLVPGSRVDVWEVRSLLGRGGMGEVYEVQRADGAYQQRAALKLVSLQSPAAILRFHAERRILADLQHPGIAGIIDGGSTDDGRPYMVMEFVEGEPITAYCERRRLGLKDRLALFLDACDALAHAHGRLVVHRDIKPGNLFVTGDGRVKLLDFGIAKVLSAAVDDQTRTQLVLTPVYAAPEQLANRPVGTATDIYSMGALLFHLLSGRPPVDADTTSMSALVSQVLDADFPAASLVASTRRDAPVSGTQLAGDLDAILARCLRRDPDARYASIDALADDIRAFRDHRPVSARAGSRAYRTRQFFRRYAWQSVAVATLFLVLLTGILTSLWFAAQARDALNESRVAREQAETALASARRAAASAANRAQQKTQLTEAFVRVLGKAQSEEPGGEEVRAFLEARRQDALRAQAEGSKDAEALLIALGEVYVQRGEPGTVVEMLTPLLERSDVSPRNRAAANALVGSAYLNQGELESAIAPLEASIAYYRDEPGFEPEYVKMISLLAHARRDPEARRAANEVMLRFLGKENPVSPYDGRLKGFLWSELGFNYLRLSELEQAEHAMAQAKLFYQAADGPAASDLGIILTNLGGIRYRLGKLEEAVETFRESADYIRTTAGPGMNLANAQRFLASMLIKLDRADESLMLLDEVKAQVEAAGLETGALYFVAANTRTRALLTDGQMAAAEAHAHDVIRSIESVRPDDAANVGSAHYELANVLAATDRADEALDVLTRSDTIFQALGERRDQAMARNNKLRASLEAPVAQAEASSSKPIVNDTSASQ